MNNKSIKMSEYIKLNNIPKYNEYNEYYTLDDEQFKLLEDAVIEYLPTKLKHINYNSSTSYHLKHVFERLLGFYVSNYDMKLVMCKLGYDSGYQAKYSRGMNFYYNISNRELKKLEMISRGKYNVI